MKTDQLINILSTNLEPVKRGQIAKTLALALIVGGTAAFCVMLSTVGLRSGLTFSLNFLALKLFFTLSLLGIGTVLLARLARPGHSGKKLSTLTFLPFLVIAIAGAVALGFESPMTWGRMLLGMNWITCLFCIPLFAVIPFIAFWYGAMVGLCAFVGALLGPRLMRW